jgi:hypothetical protein
VRDRARLGLARLGAQQLDDPGARLLHRLAFEPAGRRARRDSLMNGDSP